jgi:Clp amino terminal domain, pathogenicity island component
VSGAGRDGVFLPHGPGAGQSLRNALREAHARYGTQIGTEHLAFGLLDVDEGLVPPILAALGVSAPVLRAAIVDRYRQAG